MNLKAKVLWDGENCQEKHLLYQHFNPHVSPWKPQLLLTSGNCRGEMDLLDSFKDPRDILPAEVPRMNFLVTTVGKYRSFICLFKLNNIS